MSAGENESRPVEKPSRASRQSDPGDRPSNNPWVITVGTVVLIVVGVALVASLVNLWPSVDNATTTGATGGSSQTEHTVRLLFATVSVRVMPSTALILLVVIVGALGSLIHAATSFADFVGNRRFYSSWLVWYSIRLIVGLSLALLMYFAFRGGFFSGSAQSTAVNPYGIAALSGLAGLFSKQATDKLREVFETLFRVSPSGGDAQRKDDLANAAPLVTRIEPTHVTVGSTQTKLAIYGDHFVDGTSVVRVNGVRQDTTFVSTQQVNATLPDELLLEEGSLHITVYSGPPGGGESQPPAILAVMTSVAGEQA